MFHSTLHQVRSLPWNQGPLDPPNGNPPKTPIDRPTEGDSAPRD